MTATRVTIWLAATRPRTLPAAVAPVLVGTAAAWREGKYDGAAAGLPVFWCHDATRRIGTVDTLVEDDRGLRVTGTITGRDVAVGQGLSFGYRVRAAGKTGPFRELNALDLIEVSLVAQPMQPLARVIATRLQSGEPQSNESQTGETAWTMK